MAWNQTRDEFAGVREAALWLPTGGEADDESTTGDIGDDVADAPSWMMAAVFSAPREIENQKEAAEPPANQRPPSNQRLENE
jgi:hypothetical protein